MRDRLERKVRKLSVKLEALVKEAKIRACPKDCFETMLADMKDKVLTAEYIQYFGMLEEASSQFALPVTRVNARVQRILDSPTQHLIQLANNSSLAVVGLTPV